MDNGQVLEKEIKIETIDKLPPKAFTITANTTETSIIVNGETTDEDATTENACSGIDRYEYIVVNGAGTENIYNTNEITELEPGKYTVYMIAYDKVGNASIKSNEVTVKINYYEWKKYSKRDIYGFKQTDYSKKDRTLEGHTVYYFNGFGDNISRDLKSIFDKYTGKFSFSSYGSNYPNTHEPMYVNGYMIVTNSSSANVVYVTWVGTVPGKASNLPWTVKECVRYTSYKTGEYEKGDQYLGVVGSTNSEEYPQNGYKDGYWYEKID